jgi:hypothetical protein
MSTVSRGFRGRRRPPSSCHRASTWSKTFPSCRRDRHPASTSRTGSSPSPTEPASSGAGDWDGFCALPSEPITVDLHCVAHCPSCTPPGRACRWTPRSTAWRPAPASRWSPPTAATHQPAAGGPDRRQGLDRLPLRRPGAQARAWWPGAAGGAPPVFVEERQVGPRNPAAGPGRARLLGSLGYHSGGAAVDAACRATLSRRPQGRRGRRPQASHLAA